MYIPPKGIPGNIVGIFSPEIWPDSGLHGPWVFSGDWVCIYTTTPSAPCLAPRYRKGFFYKKIGQAQKYCQELTKKSPE